MVKTARLDSIQWLRFFELNAKNTLDMKGSTYVLSDVEKDRITSSIRKFQIGEASEGQLLKKKAASYAKSAGDPIYPRLIQYLIREENRHSGYLGQFMRAQGIALKKRTWTDGIFRVLRNLAGLELSIRVLVTAESIALSYYASLATATDSPELKAICERMCEEEREHVRFQMFTIQSINLGKFPLFSAWMDIAHALLMAAATGVVAWEHRRVIRTRLSLTEFFAEAYDHFREAMDQGREDAWKAFESKKSRRASSVQQEAV